mgnify:FL=1
MTYLIVGQDTEKQESMVLEIISKSFGKIYSEITDIYKIPDVHILELKEKNSIGIEDVKNFQSEMKFKPFEQNQQFGIIFESEKLTHQAQNALLKTLEESEDNTVYLLCVDNEKNLLQTIISRSQLIYLTGKQSREESIEIPNILSMNLVEQFGYVEEVSKSKVGSFELINNLEQYYKQILDENIINRDMKEIRRIKNNLLFLNDCRMNINANCNKRMVLESLVINLQS